LPKLTRAFDLPPSIRTYRALPIDCRRTLSAAALTLLCPHLKTIELARSAAERSSALQKHIALHEQPRRCRPGDLLRTNASRPTDRACRCTRGIWATAEYCRRSRNSPQGDRRAAHTFQRARSPPTTTGKSKSSMSTAPRKTSCECDRAIRTLRDRPLNATNSCLPHRHLPNGARVLSGVLGRPRRGVNCVRLFAISSCQ
jgi:hypothetical protein